MGLDFKIFLPWSALHSNLKVTHNSLSFLSLQTLHLSPLLPFLREMKVAQSTFASFLITLKGHIALANRFIVNKPLLPLLATLSLCSITIKSLCDSDDKVSKNLNIAKYKIHSHSLYRLQLYPIST